jgi:hypothetical protein
MAAAAQWYYARDGRQSGPVTSAQLRALAKAGELSSSDLVWKEGFAAWVPASQIRGLLPPDALGNGEPAPDGAPPDWSQAKEALNQAAQTVGIALHRSREGFDRYHAAVAGGFWDDLLSGIRRTFPASLIDWLSRCALQSGTVALALFAVIAPAYSIIQSIQLDSLLGCAVAVIKFLVLVIMLYVARRMIATLNQLIRGTPTRMASTAFLDCLVLISLLIGVVTVGLAGFATVTGEMPLLGYCAAVFIATTSAYGAMLCLHPTLLNVVIAPDVSFGEEAVGVMSGLLKVFLCSVPVLFGMGVIVGTVGYAISAAIALAGTSDAREWIEQMNRFGRSGLMPRPVVFLLFAGGFEGAVVTSALLPVFAYVTSVMGYLALDCARSIMIVPRKLDALVAVLAPGDADEDMA